MSVKLNAKGEPMNARGRKTSAAISKWWSDRRERRAKRASYERARRRGK